MVINPLIEIGLHLVEQVVEFGSEVNSAVFVVIILLNEHFKYLFDLFLSVGLLGSLEDGRSLLAVRSDVPVLQAHVSLSERHLIARFSFPISLDEVSYLVSRETFGVLLEALQNLGLELSQLLAIILKLALEFSINLLPHVKEKRFEFTLGHVEYALVGA